MAENREPTNLDIYRLLGGIDEQVNQIHEQAKATNGRVTKLEKWKEQADVIATYLKENPSQPQKTALDKAEGWTFREKTLTGFITALLAILATLVGTGKL